MDWKLELVVVPVSDVDRAKHFYADLLGFNVDVDHSPSEEFRVVQLTPPGSACSITIGKGLTEAVPGTLKGLQISVADIDAARAELAERGVDVSPVRHFTGAAQSEDAWAAPGWEEGKGGDWNSFFFFNDPDGNGWAVQESPTLRAEAEAGTA
jgi:catechol 2,3-dioxygenase-like lactoylglutathione lyase family enzyme